MKKVSTLAKWWEKYGQTVLMVIIISLASTIAFQFGQIKATNDTKIDLTVRDIKNINPAQEEANMAIEALKRQGVDVHKEIEQEKNAKEKCLFIASRNSKKYHTKDCKYGKKIKDSNLICFESIEEARNKGYLPAGGCLGKH
jgi:hypothetical protein